MKVQSSNIEEIDYSNTLQELTVTFKHGATYRYFGVTEAEWSELEKRTESPELHVGAYFAKEIKPNHSFQKVVTP